jgi:hypothetical protein
MPKANPERLRTSAHERGYIEGRRRTLLNLLSQTLGDLNPKAFGKPEDDPLVKLGRAMAERGEVVQLLRSVCAEYGDNDWDDEDDLKDVIDCHLVKHLST